MGRRALGIQAFLYKMSAHPLERFSLEVATGMVTAVGETQGTAASATDSDNGGLGKGLRYRTVKPTVSDTELEVRLWTQQNTI